MRELAGHEPIPALQSMRFDRRKWTPAAALKWMRAEGVVPIKPADVTAQWLRYRIHPPVPGARYVTMTDDASGTQIIGMLPR